MGVFIISMVLAGLYYDREYDDAFKECSKKTDAIVIGKFNRIQKGTYIRYQYEVEGQAHEFLESTTGSEYDPNGILVGDTIPIIYACAKPSLAQIIVD